jgi:hypothetical protein
MIRNFKRKVENVYHDWNWQNRGKLATSSGCSLVSSPRRVSTRWASIAGSGTWFCRFGLEFRLYVTHKTLPVSYGSYNREVITHASQKLKHEVSLRDWIEKGFLWEFGVWVSYLLIWTTSESNQLSVAYREELVSMQSQSSLKFWSRWNQRVGTRKWVFGQVDKEVRKIELAGL